MLKEEIYLGGMDVVFDISNSKGLRKRSISIALWNSTSVALKVRGRGLTKLHGYGNQHQGFKEKIHLGCTDVIFDIHNNKGLSKRFISVALHGCGIQHQKLSRSKTLSEEDITFTRNVLGLSSFLTSTNFCSSLVSLVVIW